MYIYLGAERTVSTVSGEFVLAHEKIGNHEEGMNVLFGDGHTQWVDAPAAKRMLAELAAGHNPPNGPQAMPEIKVER